MLERALVPTIGGEEDLQTPKEMKRIGNLYNLIISKENLMLAAKNAMKRKKKQYGVRVFRKDVEGNIDRLHEILKNKTYRTSEYKHRTINEGKERDISILKFYPDRIVHWAIMLQLEPMFVSTFTADSYSCIKGRGINAAVHAVTKMLKDVAGTTYCLKFDVKKCYPSIDHGILKHFLERKIKDRDLLNLLFEIIDSAPGVPIGNYLSQYFANLYLTPLDRFVKQTLRVKNYVRYLDDVMIFSASKEYLHNIQEKIIAFLWNELKLVLNRKRQVFPIEKRGADFCGVVFHKKHRRLRKRIKKAFCKAVVRMELRPSIHNKSSLDSYMGWMQYADTKNLVNKLLKPNESIQRAGGEIKKPDRR